MTSLRLRRIAGVVGVFVAVLAFALGADRWASGSPDGFERVAIDNELLVADAEPSEVNEDGITVADVARTAAAVVAVALPLLAIPRLIRRAAAER